MKTKWTPLITLLALFQLMGCDPEVEEPDLKSFPVKTSAVGVSSCTNAEGFEIELSSLRVAFRDLEFSIEGETHAGLLHRLSDLIIPSAFAHPGHYAGGEVTGELAGNFLIDLTTEAGTRLGDATLLVGTYNGVNLSFRRADESDGLPLDDPLIGHTAELAGTATRGEQTIEFSALIDVSDETQMVGGPFELSVTSDTEVQLELPAYTIDPSENDTLFDGLDFAALDDDQDGRLLIQPGDAAHNVLMKTLIRHDHWGVVVTKED